MKLFIKKIYYFIDKIFSFGRIKILLAIKRKKKIKIKIIIGSARTRYKSWIETNIYSVNLLKLKSLKTFFKENEIDYILAEHVFEHLTLEQGLKGLNNCHQFLKKGGHVRVAVPDGYFNNKDYLESVRPGGYGSGAHDHKVLYNYKSIKKIVDTKKYNIHYLEYFDENGNFIENNWSTEEGFVQRSKRYDRRNKDGLKYTSLILDIKKI